MDLDPSEVLDGCDLDFSVERMADEDIDWFVLFADALDPATEVTVESAEACWSEVFR